MDYIRKTQRIPFKSETKAGKVKVAMGILFNLITCCPVLDPEL